MKGSKMMRLLTLGLVMLAAGGCASVAAEPTAESTAEPTNDASGMANPAAVYCEAQGHAYEIRTAADGGQYGVCIAQGGETCDGWAFYRGECSLDGEVPEADEAEPADETADWVVYANSDYGFTFRYPREWSLAEEEGGYQPSGRMAPRSIKLSRNTLSLLIQYKRVAEDAVLGPGGRGAGDIVDSGTVSLFGLDAAMKALVFEGKVKSAFVSVSVDELMFTIQLDDLTGPDVAYDEIDLNEAIQADFEAVLSSFARTGEEQSWDVVGWPGYVIENPPGAQFDDAVVLLPEGAGSVGVAGATPELEAEIVALRDKPAPGREAHLWGTLTCNVPDVNGCQLEVTRLRYGARDTAPEAVEGWTGTLISNPPGAQFDDYLVLSSPLGVGYGIHSLDAALQDQLESLRDTGTHLRVWGDLRCGVPDAFGSQIEVTRIELPADHPAQ